MWIVDSIECLSGFELSCKSGYLMANLIIIFVASRKWSNSVEVLSEKSKICENISLISGQKLRFEQSVRAILGISIVVGASSSRVMGGQGAGCSHYFCFRLTL